MQILQWLFRVTHEEQSEDTSSTLSKHKVASNETSSKDIVSCKNHRRAFRTKGTKKH